MKRILIICLILVSFLFFSCKKGSSTPFEPEPEPSPEQNRPPVITSNPLTQVNEHDFYEYSVQAHDPDGNPISYSISEGPAWLSVSHNVVYGTAPEVLEDTDFPVKIRASDGQKGSAEQAFNLTVKTLYNVYALLGNQLNQISNIDETSLTFSQPVDFAENDVIVAGVSNTTPYGFLREVTGFSSDKKKVYTKQATLEDAIKHSSFSITQTLSPSAAKLSNATLGVSEGRMRGFNFSINLNNVFLGGVEGFAEVTANGNISFNLDYILNGNFRKKLEEKTFQIIMNEKADVKLTSNTYSFIKGIEKTIARYDFPPVTILTPAGLPIVVTPKLDIVVGIMATKMAYLETRVVQEANLNAGLVYENASWRPISDFSNSFDYSVSSVQDETDVEVYAALGLKIFLYELLPGPQFSLSNGLELDAEADNDWKLYGKLFASAGIDMNVFSPFVSDYIAPVISFEKLLAESKPGEVSGEILFVSTRDGNAEVYIMNADGTNQQNLTKHSEHDYDLAWSPDKAKIVFVSERDGNPEIYTMNLGGSNLKRLTNNNSVDRMPHWSPNGSEIVFYSERDNDRWIWLMNSDGTNQRKLNLPFGVHEEPKWCGSSDQIVFSSTLSGEGHFDIYKVNCDGTGLQRLTDSSSADVEPVCNFDGSKIAFSSNRSGRYDIWVMNGDGSNQINLSNTSGADDYLASWSPDGVKIVYASGNIDRSSSDIWIMNSNGSGKTRITYRTTGSNQHPVWSSK